MPPDLPPGPRAPALLQTWSWIRRPVELLNRCRARYGARFTLRFIGGRHYLLVSDPADVKAVFTLPADSFQSANRAMEPFVGAHSLFVLEGERHRRHRRLIGPPLRGEKLPAYARGIGELTDRDLDAWPLGKPFPVVERMRAVALQVIFRAIFGVEDAARAARLTTLVHALTDRASALFAFLRPLQRDLGAFSPWGRFVRARAELLALLGEEIRRARQVREQRDDILARMLGEGVSEGDPLTDEEVADELITLLAAGHETSTATIGWVFQWILADQQLHEGVKAEVRGALGAGPLDGASLERLPLLDAVIAESMRLSPIIPIVPRLLAREVELDGLRVPAGTYLTPCAYLTHHDPQVFAEPERFSPERFLGARVSPFDFYPFGGGHRHCIGSAFALYEARAIVARVLARADLRLAAPAPQPVRRHGITLTPALGTPIVVERRS